MTDRLSPAQRARLRNRYHAERRFKLYGQIAIGIAVSFLAIMLISIGLRATSAFSRHMVVLQLDPSAVAAPADLSVSDLNLAVRGEFLGLYPELADERSVFTHPASRGPAADASHAESRR